MAEGITLQGMYDLQDIALRGATPPTNLYLALVASTPDKNTDTLSDLTEIAAGNGYTSGGYQLNRDTTDWPSLVKGTSDVTATLKELLFTASGGAMPPSGTGATYAVLTTDGATVADRKVWAYWALGTTRTVVDGQALKITNARLKLQEPSS